MATKTQKLNFEKICRACLQIKKDMRPLFEQLTATMLMGISKVQVSVGDGLPGQLCLQCVHQISRSHAFKEQVERNDATLREHAKLMAEEALKVDVVESKSLLGCDSSQFIQFIEVPALSGSSQLLENFFTAPDPPPPLADPPPAAHDTKIEIELEAKPSVAAPGAANGAASGAASKEDALNSDEESYLQMVVLQATSAAAPGRHVCTLCHKEFKHGRWLKLHMRSHANWIRANCKKPPSCPVCERTFKGPGMLKMHMRTHEQRAPKQPTCSVCQRTFPSKTLLYRHRQTHFEQKTHQCVFCDKRFFSGYALRSHTARHRGERPHVCSICSKSFYNPTDLKVHFRLHTGEKPLKCSECNKTFRRHSTLCQHMKKHRGIRNHVCKVCGKGFYEVSKLNAHMRVHTGERPFSCGMCDRKFAQQSALIYHRRTHTGEKPYACKLCSARFTTSSARNNHVLTHTAHAHKRFACPVCFKACASRAELRAHSASHAGERLFGCDACGARFASPAALVAHRRHHATASPASSAPSAPTAPAAPAASAAHACAVCGKGFAELSAYKKHVKSHAGGRAEGEEGTPPAADRDKAEDPQSDQGGNAEGGAEAAGGVKKFKCGICVKSYTYLHSLKKHLLSHVQMCVFSPDGSERLYAFKQQQQQDQLQQQQQHQQQQQQVQQVQLQQQHVQQLQQQVLQVGGVQQLAVPIHAQQLQQGIVQSGQHAYPVISSVQSLQLQQTHQLVNSQPQQLQVQTIQIHPQHQPIQIHAVGVQAVGVQQVQQEQLHVATSSCQTMLPNILQLQPGAVAVSGLTGQELGGGVGGVAHRIILQPQHHPHHPLYTIHH